MIELFDHLVHTQLFLLDHLLARQHRRARNALAIEPSQPIGARALAQDGGRQLEARLHVDDAAIRGLEALVRKPRLALERATQPGPLVVGDRARLVIPSGHR